MISAFTDYPFEAFGDVLGKEAPIRECTILTYDRDKYCYILVRDSDKKGDVQEHISCVKSGYLYKNKIRLTLETIDDVQRFSEEELDTLPWTLLE